MSALQCPAAGAAATGSTEPERLRQLSGVAHHIANAGETVTKCHQFVDIAEMVCFREAVFQRLQTAILFFFYFVRPGTAPLRGRDGGRIILRGD